MKTQPKSLLTLPLASCLMLVVGACGGSGEDGSPTENGTENAVEGEVLVNHVPLTDEQIDEIEETYEARIVPGDYWYDPVSGLFGSMGMPSFGQLYPGHDFGSLPADASNGTSGVFVNGRQLTDSEVQSLSFFTGFIMPGRYWMDGMSTVGYEGNPMPLLNLYLLMAQKAQAGGGAPPGGGDNGWSSMYGSGNYNSDNSSGYVHIPSSTGGSGTFVSY